jgi:GAF domain-containing protein
MARASDLGVARQFSTVAHDLMTQPDLAMTRARIVSAAVELTGCTSAALGSVKASTGLAVSAGTDLPLAAQLARIAVETSGGTALQATLGQAAACPSVRRERRWRHYAQRVLLETPVRSEVSYPLQLPECDFGVLSLYSDQDGYFTEDARATAEIYAGHVLMALSHARERDRAANLEIGLASNREIGIAIGVLMTTHRVTHQQAFEMLRTASQHAHLKLRDVAAEVVLTGELPAAPVRPADSHSKQERSLAVA